MKKTILLHSLILLVLLLAACKTKPHVAPFQNQDHWDEAKKQRWAEVKQFMNTHATDAIEGDQRVHRSRAEWNHFTTATQLQAFYDGYEQRRTGNPSATSCRHVLDLDHADYTRCSLDQLTAELFQYDEELHQRH